MDLSEIRRELTELRAEMAALRNNGHSRNGPLETLSESSITDRRGMLKKVAGLAVGVATVGLLHPVTSKGSNGSSLTQGKGQIPNANGDPLLVGQINTASADTFLNQSGATSFAIQNTSVTVLDTDPPLIGRNWAANLPVAPTGAIGTFGATSAVGSTTPNTDVYGVVGFAETTGTGASVGVFGIGDDIGVRGKVTLAQAEFLLAPSRLCHSESELEQFQIRMPA